MLFCDSHAHLTSPDVLMYIQPLLQRAKEAGVDRVINICTDPITLNEGIRLAQTQQGIANAGATTPHDVEARGDSDFLIFAQAAKEGILCAIGETGLDYHYQHSDRKIQQRFLVRYLHLAAEVMLPVIFHCREAFSDLFRIVDAEYPKKAPAVLHCFTGTRAEAEQVLDRGWYLSMSGVITFKKNTELRKIAQEMPLQQLLIETDTPYLAPQSRRGKVNEPSFIVETASCIASERGIDLSAIAKVTRDNAIRLFHLSN